MKQGSLGTVNVESEESKIVFTASHGFLALSPSTWLPTLWLTTRVFELGRHVPLFSAMSGIITLRKEWTNAVARHLNQRERTLAAFGPLRHELVLCRSVSAAMGVVPQPHASLAMIGTVLAYGRWPRGGRAAADMDRVVQVRRACVVRDCLDPGRDRALRRVSLPLTCTLRAVLTLAPSRTRYGKPQPRPAPSSLPPDELPGVSILRPLRGLDCNLSENLESSFLQSYQGPCEILFSVAEEGDAAIPIVHELMRKYPRVEAQLVIGELSSGCWGWRNAC